LDLTLEAHAGTVGNHGFLYVKNGDTCIFPQTAPLIVPDQEVTIGASVMRWLKVVEMCQLNTGTAGGCVPVDSLTLKLVEVRNGGL